MKSKARNEGDKLGLSWAKLSLSWGLGEQFKPERLHLGLGLNGWVAKIGFNGPHDQ